MSRTQYLKDLCMVYTISCKIESNMNRKAKTNVILKTNPSSPRLEKAVKELPQTLPNPTPFT